MINTLQDWFTLLFGTGFIATVIGWVVERRKRKAETQTILANNETIEITNDDKKFEQYQKILDDLPERYEKRYKEFEEMHNRKIQLLEDEIALHKRVIATLKAENHELRKKIREYASRNPT